MSLFGHLVGLLVRQAAGPPGQVRSGQVRSDQISQSFSQVIRPVGPPVPPPPTGHIPDDGSVSGAVRIPRRHVFGLVPSVGNEARPAPRSWEPWGHTAHSCRHWPSSQRDLFVRRWRRRRVIRRPAPHSHDCLFPGGTARAAPLPGSTAAAAPAAAAAAAVAGQEKQRATAAGKTEAGFRSVFCICSSPVPSPGTRKERLPGCSPGPTSRRQFAISAGNCLMAVRMMTLAVMVCTDSFPRWSTDTHTRPRRQIALAHAIEDKVAG